MHWQKAILSSPSKRAARQNIYAVYVRYADGSAVVLPKKHSGIRDAKSQEVEGFDDWVSLEEYEAAQHKMHPTLGESPASDSESNPAPKRVIQTVRQTLRERGIMNNIKLLKAQSNRALTQVDPRLKIGIENYISALEAIYEASVTFANNLHASSNPEIAEITLEVDPQDLAAFEQAVCRIRRAADASPGYVIQKNRYVASRR